MYWVGVFFTGAIVGLVFLACYAIAFFAGWHAMRAILDWWSER